MLITNTPNSELHIYNNDGEEIVTLDDKGVIKPEIGSGGGSGVDIHYPIKTDGSLQFAFYRVGEFTLDDYGNYVISQADMVAYNEWVKNLSPASYFVTEYKSGVTQHAKQVSRITETTYNDGEYDNEWLLSNIFVTTSGAPYLEIQEFTDEPNVLYMGCNYYD